MEVFGFHLPGMRLGAMEKGHGKGLPSLKLTNLHGESPVFFLASIPSKSQNMVDFSDVLM